MAGTANCFKPKVLKNKRSRFPRQFGKIKILRSYEPE
jgi:hypothetical protein